jgi:hypothetical protein
MPGKSSAIARSLAAGVALMLLLAAPPAAFAATENPWKLWVEDLNDREYKIEIPFLVLVSILPMIAITPFWLGKLALDAMEGDD